MPNEIKPKNRHKYAENEKKMVKYFIISQFVNIFHNYLMF